MTLNSWKKSQPFELFFARTIWGYTSEIVQVQTLRGTKELTVNCK